MKNHKKDLRAMLATVAFLTPTAYALITHQNEVVQQAGLACMIFAVLAFFAILFQAGAWLMQSLRPIPEQTGTWVSSNGCVRICDMDDDHLCNTILFLKRRSPFSDTNQELLPSMILETERRKRIPIRD